MRIAKSENSALLIASAPFYRPGGGGMQICHREYVAALEAAGFALDLVSYHIRASFALKVAKKLLPQATFMSEPPGLLSKVESLIARGRPSFIFWERFTFPAITLKLKEREPSITQVLLSHGVNSIDISVAQRADAKSKGSLAAAWVLGRELTWEAEQRHGIDAVLTLSPFEADMEGWIGAAPALWTPRTIMEAPLQLQPVDGRVGCVATLDHMPNFHGLTRLFDALAKVAPRDFRFRLVGQPANKGKMLAARYPFIDYLGPLSDTELQVETATWCCFVHPVFVYAQGCSTKLAVALGWGLPIATTGYGIRGYIWDEAVLPVAETPEELAAQVVQKSRLAEFATHQRQSNAIRNLTPTLSDVGTLIREFLFANGMGVKNADMKPHQQTPGHRMSQNASSLRILP